MIILKKNKKILELFPIEIPKGALNFRRKPLFYGYLRLKRIGTQIKPYRFIVRKDKEILIPPSEAVKILRKQKIYLVGRDKETEEMLKSLNVEYKRTKICKHCILEGYIKIITLDSSYLFQNDHICRRCAEEEIKRELKFLSFDMSTFQIFKKMLDSTGDLNEVLKVLDPNFDPIKNTNLTLYDRISSEDISEHHKIRVDDLKIPNNLKKVIKNTGKHLLPVQSLTLENGLLEGEDILVVSATASGKTLIGELAGVPRALNGRKFVFLTPLVALANQKYRDFKKKYKKLGLKVSIRVGMSRIKANEEISIVDDYVKDADIIVGTYEGLDFLLRSGKSGELGDVGTVVIDEIQMLDDDERGPRLNGLIRRLKTLFPSLQLIGLSATVKNSREIADEFGMKLVEYDKRPVPLERHLIFARSEYEKMDIISKLSRAEYKNVSKKGFHGQSIIFTNSRRKTHLIANYLSKKHINTAAYHAGLSYAKKSRIEKDFLDQKISTVVTTAALAAGVDFPASQVIFETLTMGNKWITPNEFSQMLGRAGRPSYHDIGKIFLIPEVGRKYDDDSEEKMAVNLLESDLDPINVQYSNEDIFEQCLADICSGCAHSFSDIKRSYKKIESSENLECSYAKMLKTGVTEEKDAYIISTSYGRAVSVSFLNKDHAKYIKENVIKENKKADTKVKSHISPLNTTIKLEPFDNAYLSNGLHKKLVKILKIKLSSRLFADSTLDIISSGETLSKLDPNLQESLINMQIEFLSCKCSNRPFCGCFQAELSKKIVKYRIMKKDPIDISKKLLKDYQIHAYAGDIFSWLDSVIRMLEAIRRISKALRNRKIEMECSSLIKALEN
ncbi:MAG: DEAD/DEAH box helicase [Euryarchaeota archaeon]|nr:DEAD/DEAH box helicase [Euryarchaeota archaeon]